MKRDYKRRLLVAHYELKRAHYRALSQDRNLPLSFRFKMVEKLASLPRNSSKTRVRNRCTITGRPRGIYRRFRISRILCRFWAAQGIIPGVTQSSW